jgi:hypothetical protein
MFQLGGVGCNDPDQSQVILYASFIHHTILIFMLNYKILCIYPQTGHVSCNMTCIHSKSQLRHENIKANNDSISNTSVHNG